MMKTLSVSVICLSALALNACTAARSAGDGVGTVRDASPMPPPPRWKT
ncbi:hypothetical protein [Brevundimonas abyssalis]|nr:hypothetical protein [Brevundimonas abyssalis]